MTQQEFESRTLVKVDATEFDAIHTVYLASDLDKDAFCRAWCRMNASRVKAAKVERIIANREQANREYAWCLVNFGYKTSDFFSFADEYFTAKQRNFIETRLHIPFVGQAPDGTTYRRLVSGVIGKINQYLFEKDIKSTLNGTWLTA